MARNGTAIDRLLIGSGLWVSLGYNCDGDVASYASAGFVASPGDELTLRTLPVFSGVLELLLRAGVTAVAEAAFQDRTWRRVLDPLSGLARFRVVHCIVDAEVAFRRNLRRGEDDPLRRAHADLGPRDAAEHDRAHRS